MPIAEESQAIVKGQLKHLKRLRSGNPRVLKIKIEYSLLDEGLEIELEVLQMKCERLTTSTGHTAVSKHGINALLYFLRKLQCPQSTT